MTPHIAALIVAAGRGSRAGGGLPKQYRALGGATVLRRALTAFVSHPGITRTVAVIHPDDEAHFSASSAGLDVTWTAGGATRQDSVLRGLRSLADSGATHVLIHDGARPLVSKKIIADVIHALVTAEGAAPGLAIADSLKHVSHGSIMSTVPRDHLWRVQTPQGFVLRSILAAHEAAAGQALTDDAAVAEAAGLTVAIVAGDDDNLKITTADDLAHAERLLTLRTADVRTGSGFDVHRFSPGDHVWLCGVKVPHSHGLDGHSDADAGLHALTDALLGALGDGDIGAHFPPTDPQWKGADSSEFLRHAADLLTRRGGVLAHADVTLICERPKISLHRGAMVQRIADILQVAPDRVSVKATTTEQLGFTGRREGLAAQAVVTIRLPL